jgi:hypothetical protein
MGGYLPRHIEPLRCWVKRDRADIDFETYYETNDEGGIPGDIGI